MIKFNKICPVCNGKEFLFTSVLWDQLINEWELTSYEVDYINKQQGFHCKACKNNMRSMVLAKSITDHFAFNDSLENFTNCKKNHNLNLLEINEAGCLTPFFSKLPGHRLIKYPYHDITNLGFPKNTYDIIIHSDTLEHVQNPIAGLSECRRILKPGGTCFFTIPIIVGRMTRSRHGLPPSFHTPTANQYSDFLVHTEYGADFWTHIVMAGFAYFSVFLLEYPSAIAIKATKQAL